MSDLGDDDEGSINQVLANVFGEMIDAGHDPQAVGDAMLCVAGLLIAKHRGVEAAKLSLLSGLNFIARHEPPTSEP